MELRAGYKQTEVGAIPEDWKVVRAGEIGRFRGGNGFPLKFQGQKSGTYPFYKVSDMNNEGNDIFMSDANNWLSEQVLSQIGATLFPANSIIFAKVGAAVFLERKKILSRPSCIDNNVAALVLDKSKAEVRFIHCLMLNIKFGAFANATALPSLSGATLFQIQLTLPPLPEQQAIANALNDVDDLIASLDRLIAKKRDIKQAAMQQLLTGKTRLKGFSGEWETKRLGTVISIRNEKVNTLGSEIAAFCIELEQIGQNSGQIDGHSDARGRQTMKYRFERGDVLFGRLRPYLRKYWLAEREGVCSTEIWPLVTINEQLARDFLFQTVQSDAFIDAANSSYGTHMPRSDWKALTQFEFLVPRDIAEQQAIGQLLCDMDAEMKELQRRRDKSIEIKQGMMQELLTGRTRLI